MAGKLISRTDENILYLYGITKSVPSRIPRIPGVTAASSVEPNEISGLICWTSRVPKDEFADDLAGNMENLDWLSEKGVAHQAAVNSISQLADILPARFGTVFLTEQSLQADIKKRKREILSDLERIEGSDEWGVKVLVVPPRVMTHNSVGGTGKSYLQAKSQVLRRKVPVKADQEVERFDSELRAIAMDTAAAGKIGAGRRDLVYQISLLVKRADRKRFEALLRRFSSDWNEKKVIECTGPWPAYSFVSRRSE
jgi:hypothetical protein